MLHYVLSGSALLLLHQQVTGGYYGLGIPILFLRGSSVQKLPDRYRCMSGFGEGKFRSDKWWKAFGESALCLDVFCSFLLFLFLSGFNCFLLLSITFLSTRIVSLRFQAGGCRKRPNLGLVCSFYFVLSVFFS